MATDSKTVYVIPSFHYDVVYLKSYEEYLAISFKILDAALDMLDSEDGYHFLVEQVILLKEYWTRRPQQQSRLRRHAASGRLAVAPGMFVMPDMNHVDGESLFQQARIGKAWLEANLGIDSTVAWIADCWGHHGQLPQILSQCGYHYYVFWRCMRRDVRTTYFLWRGLDGTTIKTHWLARGYSGISFPDSSEIANALDLDLVQGSVGSIAEAARDLLDYNKTEGVLLCNGGDFRMPQATAADVVDAFNASQSEFHARFATPQMCLDAVDWTTKPLFDGEFNSAFQGTFTTNIRLKQQVRELVIALTNLETLAVARRAPREYLELWEGVLKLQFHDTICGSLCDDGLAESLAEASALGEAIRRELSELPDAQEDKKSGQTLSGPSAGAGKAPSTGSHALPLEFTGAYYTATVGADGYLTSLRLTEDEGAELVSPEPAPFGVLAMQMDYGDSWLNFEGPISGGSVESSLTQNYPDPLIRDMTGSVADRRTFFPTEVNATAHEAGGGRITIEQTGVLSFWRIRVAFRTVVTLDPESRCISYRTEIIPQGAHYRIRAAFPTPIHDGRIRHEIPMGTQERETGEHVAQRWIDYATDVGGLALLNRGIPANNVDDGTLLLTLFRSVDMEYKSPSIATRNEGVPHIFEYALFPHGADSDGRIIREAATFATADGTQVGAESVLSAAGFNVDSESVAVSALRWAGDKIFLRLYEATGAPVDACNVTVPADVGAWQYTDGLQRPVSEPVACDGSIALQFRGFEIKAILLTLR